MTASSAGRAAPADNMSQGEQAATDDAASDDYGSVARRVRAAYVALAPEYARMTRSYDRYPGLREELTRFLVTVSPGRMLDLGCGSGRDGMHAAELGHIPVYADASIDMLRQLDTSAAAGAAVCCDVLNLPFADQVFSGALASGVFLHIPRRYCGVALTELARVLTRGGLAAISMRSGDGEGWRVTEDVPVPRWLAYYHPDDFAETCAQAGFAVLAVDRGRRTNWFTVTARTTMHP